MDNPLSKLALDYWYKVMMVVGFVIFVLAGMGVLKSFPTAPTALISLGIFWIGVGEWINHPLQTTLMPASARLPGGIVTAHPRSSAIIGVLFDILGFGLIIFGVYKFF
ncbi:MAG: hypothetical protein R8M11_06360 [Gallionella sp.]